MKHLSTDLDREQQEYQDCPEFTRRFFREVSLCIGIGFIMTIGLIWVVVNADKIDNWFSEIVKWIFL